MKEGKRIDAVGAQLHLPEAIIQRIQSFLSRKQAASTALLSKSWYSSWLTRPILDFDERDFQFLPQNDEKFFNFAITTMEKYRELGLGIESFKLWMNVRDIDSSSRATELIVKAVKLGAYDVNLEFNPPISEYLLPDELFEAKSLVRLSVIGCRISSARVMCLRLELLCLHRVYVDDLMMGDIMSGCPLLEELFLSHCEGFVEVNVGRMVKLKVVRVLGHLTVPTRTNEFEEQSVRLVFGCQPNASEFSNLSDLLLERVKIDKILFCDFSNKFPCIRNLTVHYCKGCVRFDISSHSLKHISLAHTKKLEIQLDVPNICLFKFSGAIIPALSFVTASREWDSDISLTCWNNLGFSWFHELKGLLMKLGLSKISLCIELLRVNLVEFPPDVEDYCKPVVENLILRVHCLASATIALLDGLFWSFQPRIITQCLFPVLHDGRGKAKTERLQPVYWQASNELLQLLCKKFMDLENCNCYNSNENTSGLEVVIVEFFEDKLRKWQALPWKTLCDALISSEKEVQVRFRLRWEQLKVKPYHGQLMNLVFYALYEDVV